ncbi:hypothetical protein QP157_10300 [Sphingomonas sp. LR61]|uniref:hypothetical protein n=1 Tax=Sphingomonas sp. LR61 TaxID=3050234 RepID=UPI002FE232B7
MTAAPAASRSAISPERGVGVGALAVDDRGPLGTARSITASRADALGGLGVVAAVGAAPRGDRCHVVPVQTALPDPAVHRLDGPELEGGRAASARCGSSRATELVAK